MSKFTENQEVLEISETAIGKIAELKAKSSHENPAVRVALAGGLPGGGYQTQFKFVSEDDFDEDDIVQDAGEFKLFFDAYSAAHLAGAIIDFDEVKYPGGFHIQQVQAAPIGPPAKEWSEPVAKATQEVIDTQINPAIAAHGGWVALLDVEEGKAYIEMGGGCQGCAMSYMTLKQGIEQAIMGAVAEIERVIDTTQHEEGTNPYYKETGQGYSPLSN